MKSPKSQTSYLNNNKLEALNAIFFYLNKHPDTSTVTRAEVDLILTFCNVQKGSCASSYFQFLSIIYNELKEKNIIEIVEVKSPAFNNIMNLTTYGKNVVFENFSYESYLGKLTKKELKNKKRKKWNLIFKSVGALISIGSLILGIVRLHLG